MAKCLVDLAQRRIVVSGAAGDIGGCMVALFRSLGAHVIALDRDAAALDRLRDSADGGEGQGGVLETIAVDVADEAAMAEAFRTIGGPIHGLVNGAGIENRPTPVDEMDLATFRRVLDVNVTGVFLGLKYGVPHMREAGGSIVNVASTAGIKGAAGMSAYVASKHAVVGLTRATAVECGPSGIRVNAICPGPIAGRMIDSIFGSKPDEPSPAALARMAQIPSRRFGQPQEVAATTAWLLSDAAGYVNGALMSVDGGISAI